MAAGVSPATHPLKSPVDSTQKDSWAIYNRPLFGEVSAMAKEPKVIEGTLGGRRYRKPADGPFASYPPSEEEFIDHPAIPEEKKPEKP